MEESFRKIQERVSVNHREEFGNILRGTRVSILGHGTSLQEIGVGVEREIRGHCEESWDLCLCSVAKGKFGVL